jgi:hypothetical protein
MTRAHVPNRHYIDLFLAILSKISKYRHSLLSNNPIGNAFTYFIPLSVLMNQREHDWLVTELMLERAEEYMYMWTVHTVHRGVEAFICICLAHRVTRVLALSAFWYFVQQVFPCWLARWQLGNPSGLLVQISRECTPPYLSIGIPNLLQPAQLEVVLGQRSTYLASWV